MEITLSSHSASRTHVITDQFGHLAQYLEWVGGDADGWFLRSDRCAGAPPSLPPRRAACLRLTAASICGVGRRLVACEGRLRETRCYREEKVDKSCFSICIFTPEALKTVSSASLEVCWCEVASQPLCAEVYEQRRTEWSLQESNHQIPSGNWKQCTYWSGISCGRQRPWGRCPVERERQTNVQKPQGCGGKNQNQDTGPEQAATDERGDSGKSGGRVGTGGLKQQGLRVSNWTTWHRGFLADPDRLQTHFCLTSAQEH